MTNSADPDRLLPKPTDLDLPCLLRQGMSCSAREGLRCLNILGKYCQYLPEGVFVGDFSPVYTAP